MSDDKAQRGGKDEIPMSYLDAFNHLGRHSLRETSTIAQMQQSKNSASHIYIMLIFAPYAIAMIKADLRIAFAGAAVTTGYVAAGHVYKKLRNGIPLEGFSKLLSKCDIPLFLAGNAYLFNTYLRDMFSTASSVSAGDPLLILMSGAAFWSALPGRAQHKTAQEHNPPRALPPPSAQ